MERTRPWLATLPGVMLLLAVALCPPAPAAAAELVMAEEPGCPWCRRWNEEVGVIYHKTPEGKLAPLRRVNIHDPVPADLAGIEFGAFTPTFILVDDGVEIGRIRGYPGEEFFWGLLGELLEGLGGGPDPAG